MKPRLPNRYTVCKHNSKAYPLERKKPCKMLFAAFSFVTTNEKQPNNKARLSDNRSGTKTKRATKNKSKLF